MISKRFFQVLFFFLLVQFAAYGVNTYNGSGDDFIVIEKPDKGMPALLVVKGNSRARHFSITSYDENRDYVDLLVNTTESYYGLVAIDLPNHTQTKYLEISAEGSWTIDVYHIGSAPKISIGNPVSESGDYVLWIEDEPVIAEITGNSSERHFSIISYDIYGNYGDLLVNTTSRYFGRVMIPKDTLLLNISAEGNWSIDLK